MLLYGLIINIGNDGLSLVRQSLEATAPSIYTRTRQEQGLNAQGTAPTATMTIAKQSYCLPTTIAAAASSDTKPCRIQGCDEPAVSRRNGIREIVVVNTQVVPSVPRVRRDSVSLMVAADDALILDVFRYIPCGSQLQPELTPIFHVEEDPHAPRIRVDPLSLSSTP